MPLSFHSTAAVLTVLTVAWTYEVGNVTSAEPIFGAHMAARENNKIFGPHGPFCLHVVAIADLHGDLGHTEKILRFANVTNQQQHWTGRVDILVQLGDVMDRGTRPRTIIQLLKSLRDEAAKRNGQLFLLFGNH